MASANISNASEVIKAYQEFMSNVYTQANVDATCQSVASNLMTVYYGTAPDGKTPCVFIAKGATVSSSQQANSTCNATTATDEQITSTVKTSIKDSLDQFLKQEQDTNQGWLAAAISVQSSNINTVAELSNVISQQIDTETSVVCSSSATAFNNKIVSFCGDISGGTFNDSQIAISDAYLSCTVQLIVQAWQNNAILNNIGQSVFNQQVTRQEGITSFAQYFVILIIVVVAIVIIGGIIMALISSGGRKRKYAVEQARIAAGLPPEGMDLTGTEGTESTTDDTGLPGNAVDDSLLIDEAGDGSVPE